MMSLIKNMLRFIYHFGCDLLNGLNLVKTLYFNFKFFPFRQAIKLPIYIYGKVKFMSLQGIVNIEERVSNKMIIIGSDASYFEAPQGVSLIHIDGNLTFQGKARIGHKCTLSIQRCASLYIGKYVYISNSVKIKCYRNIKIGQYTSIASESQFFDTNFHFMRNIESGDVMQLSLPIRIGDCCWIGNRTSVMKGTILPDYTIVSSNSFVSKDYSSLNSYSIIGGSPAKLLKENMTRVYDWELYGKLEKHFAESDDKYSAYKGTIDETSFIEKSYF